MTIPTFHDAGAGQSGTGSTLTGIAFPATVDNLDIAICHIVSRTTTPTSPSFPGDWNMVGDAVLGHQAAWAWKRCDGTEDATTITVGNLPGGGLGNYARIYVFRGCITTGNPYEAQTSTSGSGTSYSSSAIVTLGTDRLAICLVGIGDDDKTLAGMTGSNVTWGMTVSQFASGTGLDYTIACEDADVAAPTSVTAGSESYSGSELWGTFTFALIPADTYQPRYGYVNYVDPGVL